MSTDISSVSNARPPISASVRETSVPSAEAATQASPVKIPAKPEIKFDADAQRKNLQKALEDLNNQMKQNGRNLNFKMDDVLNSPVVTVTNAQTGEVVRQIPNEVVIRVAHNLEDLKGMLHNEKT